MTRYPIHHTKIGTVPAVFCLRSSKPLSVGDRVEFREPAGRNQDGSLYWDRWQPWLGGIVTNLDPLRLDRF